MEIGASILRKHKNYFKEIDTLYPHQEDAISNIIRQHNTLSIVPTGGGKSLIFQLGAMELAGITLVISPLVALMREQVDELNNRGIKSLALNSSIPFQRQRKIIRNLDKEGFKLIYLSPERLYSTRFKRGIKEGNIKISLVVIDEAHCISQWGGQFRPEYSQIMSFIKFLREKNNQNPTILCLTATLGQKERKDILDVFQIEDAFINKNIIRDELFLNFKKVDKETDKSSVLYDFLTTNKPKKTLVYLYSRLKCKSYAEEFKERGFNTSFYHAGLDYEQKSDSFYEFKNGEVEVMFATTAFGMGINIPDIDAVVHLQIPHSIEEYYQQVGRGARKKSKCPKCNCLMIWSDINFKKRKKNLINDKVSKGTIYEAYELMGFKDNKNRTVNKDFYTYHNATNLSSLSIYFEKYNLVKLIGDINGTPLTIRLHEHDDKWEKFKDELDGFDSFTYASETSGILIDDIINHLFELEMKGQIDHIPAMQRSLFFKVFQNDVPEGTAVKIADEINEKIDFRMKQLEEFERVCRSKNPLQLIKKVLT